MYSSDNSSMLGRRLGIALTIVFIAILLGGCSGRSRRFEPRVEAHLVRAEKHVATGRLDRAEKEISAAITSTRHKADVYLQAIGTIGSSIGPGATYARLQFASLIRELIAESDAKRLDRPLTSAEMRYLLLAYGTVSHELVRRDDAFWALERAIKLWPKDAEISNTLGYLYAEYDVNLQQALRLTKQAVAADPKNAAYIDSLGWVYYRLGRYKDAARELEKAVRFMPNHPDLRYHLGMAHLELGRKAEARVEFTKALACDSSHVGASGQLNSLRPAPAKKR